MTIGANAELLHLLTRLMPRKGPAAIETLRIQTTTLAQHQILSNFLSMAG